MGGRIVSLLLAGCRLMRFAYQLRPRTAATGSRRPQGTPRLLLSGHSDHNLTPQLQIGRPEVLIHLATASDSKNVSALPAKMGDAAPAPALEKFTAFYYGFPPRNWRSKMVYRREARHELFGMRHRASEVAYMNGEAFRRPVAPLLWNCDDLRCYLSNNRDSLIDYGKPYRSKLPVSTSRAEGCVDEIANARMAKKQRMRWSPQGAHRISTVRAAALDGRLKVVVDLPKAA
jgi:hypothetical protein